MDIIEWITSTTGIIVLASVAVIVIVVSILMIFYVRRSSRRRSDKDIESRLKSSKSIGRSGGRLIEIGPSRTIKAQKSNKKLSSQEKIVENDDSVKVPLVKVKETPKIQKKPYRKKLKSGVAVDPDRPLEAPKVSWGQGTLMPSISADSVDMMSHHDTPRSIGRKKNRLRAFTFSKLRGANNEIIIGKIEQMQNENRGKMAEQIFNREERIESKRLAKDTVFHVRSITPDGYSCKQKESERSEPQKSYESHLRGLFRSLSHGSIVDLVENAEAEEIMEDPGAISTPEHTRWRRDTITKKSFQLH